MSERLLEKIVRKCKNITMEKTELTEAEKQRQADFEVVRSQLEADGYTCHEKILTPVYANTMSIVYMLPFALLFIVLYCLYNGVFSKQIDFKSFSIWAFELRLLLVIVGMVICMVAHELIHGLFFGIFAKNGWKSVSFGFNKAAFAPYCTTKETLTKKQYIIAAVMPTIVLGFALGAVAIFIGNVWFFAVTVVMVFGGGGDFIMIHNLLKIKSKGKDVLFFDHPTAIGSYFFVKETN